MNKSAASYVEQDQCPVYTAIRRIEGRWKAMIVRRLGDSALGFGDLRRTMPGVTIKVLRQHLRQLEGEGVVARSVQQRPTLRVRYRLTPHGRTLGPLFESLWAWGVVHLAHLEDARAQNHKIASLKEDVLLLWFVNVIHKHIPPRDSNDGQYHPQKRRGDAFRW